MLYWKKREEETCGLWWGWLVLVLLLIMRGSVDNAHLADDFIFFGCLFALQSALVLVVFEAGVTLADYSLGLLERISRLEFTNSKCTHLDKFAGPLLDAHEELFKWP